MSLAQNGTPLYSLSFLGMGDFPIPDGATPEMIQVAIQDLVASGELIPLVDVKRGLLGFHAATAKESQPKPWQRWQIIFFGHGHEWGSEVFHGRAIAGYARTQKQAEQKAQELMRSLDGSAGLVNFDGIFVVEPTK